MVQQWGILVIYLPFKFISAKLRVFATNCSAGPLECNPSTFSVLAFIKRMFLSSILQDMTSCLISCLTYLRHVTQCFLPPANEVWGKVMFLHLCVILFTGGWLPSMHDRSHDQGVGGSASRGRSASKGVCIGGGLHAGVVVCIWGVGQTPLPEIDGILWDRSTSGRYASYWNAFLFEYVLKTYIPVCIAIIEYISVEYIVTSIHKHQYRIFILLKCSPSFSHHSLLRKHCHFLTL